MAFAYDFEKLNEHLKALLRRHLSAEAFQWLMETGEAVRVQGDIPKFNGAFVVMPRKTGKEIVRVSDDEQEELRRLRGGLTIQGWTADQLSRVWLLMQLNPSHRDRYVAIIENLFLSAEMGELVALYSSLPVLAHPESWRKRCAEGIRSNIGQVLESIICRNPYPSEHLEETAWNQLVLKAIFTEKPILEIIGLERRRNLTLARSLSDYAHERWAAHRDLNPLVWICVAPFIGSDNFSDIQRVFASDVAAEREAAALACAESDYPPARALIAEHPEMNARIASGDLTWWSLKV